jgi:hypothetical protein
LNSFILEDDSISSPQLGVDWEFFAFPCCVRGKEYRYLACAVMEKEEQNDTSDSSEESISFEASKSVWSNLRPHFCHSHLSTVSMVTGGAGPRHDVILVVALRACYNPAVHEEKIT